MKSLDEVMMLLFDLISFSRRWRSLPVIDWVKASRLYKSGDYRTAATFYSRGLRRHLQHPAAPSALLDLSFCEFRNKKVLESEKYLGMLLKRDPKNIEASIRLARLLLWSRRVEESLCVVKKSLCLTIKNESLRSLYLLAATGSKTLYENEKNRVYDVLSIDSEDHIDQIARARIFFFEGNTSVAKTILTKLCTASPCPLEALHTLGEILLSEGNARASKYFIKRSLALSPDNPMSLYLLAQWYGVSSAPHFAVDHARKACQITGWKSPLFLKALTEAELSIGDKVSALLIASKAEELLSGPEERKYFKHLVKELSQASLY